MMLSPVVPALILTLSLGLLLVVTPEDPDEGMSASISDNMLKYHDQHILEVVHNMIPTMGPSLNGTTAVEVSYTMTGPFSNMGDWEGYTFRNGDDLIVMTWTEAADDNAFPRDRYLRAASIINKNMRYSNRDIHAGEVSFDGLSGHIVIGDVSYEVSGVSISEGAVAVATVYRNLAG